MGLDVPELDDREYAELIEDAMKQIPIQAEEWTDHNAHDPGITVLELLSWIAETYLYQLDRITDEHRKKYLRLLGTRPEPPKPASVRLAVKPTDSAIGTTIPAGKPLVATVGSGQSMSFETSRSVTLTGATLEEVVSNHEGGRTDNSVANSTSGMYFLAFGEDAERGSTLHLGFDGDPFRSTDHLDLFVDFFEEGLPELASHGDESPTFEPSTALSWQYCTDHERRNDDESWETLSLLEDETNRLYRGGTVRLQSPEGAARGGTVGRPDDPEGTRNETENRHWIRCRVDRGGYEIPPRIASINLNVVSAHQRTTIENEPLRQPDGSTKTTALPGQRFVFEHAPVLTAVGSPVAPTLPMITVGGEPWDRVEDFDASGPDDHHYVLNRSRGEIRFGDNVRGAVPETDQTVVAEAYVHGGGKDGNLPLSTTWRFSPDRTEDVSELRDMKVEPITAATGGRDEESVDASLNRLRRDMKTPYRAVSLEDYQYIATHTPGLRFGRARAIVTRRFEDRNEREIPTIEAAGNGESAVEPYETMTERASQNEIIVVVVPASTRAKPIPSDGFLNSVRHHLEKHRLVTDRVSVRRPVYVGIGIEADVRIESGYSVRERTEAIESALEGFIDPLTGYDGEGWPFGRALYRSEIYEVIESASGVDCVLDVSIRVRSGSAEVRDGDIVIDPTALPYSDDHVVTVRMADERCREWS